MVKFGTFSNKGLRTHKKHRDMTDSSCLLLLEIWMVRGEVVKPVLVLFPHFAADYANAHLHTAKAAFLVQELIQETHV